MIVTKGEIIKVSGPVVTVAGVSPRMYDVVFVGRERLMGEVIRITGSKAIVQVYEDTTGIRTGEPVEDTGRPLSVELGPGLISSIYDGIQRPLPSLRDMQGSNIHRGAFTEALDRRKRWKFVPSVSVGETLRPGMIIGHVQETKRHKHAICAPPDIATSKVKEISEGEFSVEDTVCHMESGDGVQMMHRWPIRVPRPCLEKLMPSEPFVTGQRVLDMFFPLAKGGTAAIPGGFGTGKTVIQHQLAKCSDSDIVVYVGCGERGNEMAEVLTAFPKLEDMFTGEPLSQRTVLIANTSNMPVAAREASIYTGITMAEYYRDMGMGVSMMADSTSRWAEAMREISSRMEEMPGEEGYPAYLSSKLSEFYERAGRVRTINGAEGSVTVIGAVSPQGGDFSEPVTQSTLRMVKVFWALDTKLREKRHYPAVNWLSSYSLYNDALSDWFRAKISKEWPAISRWAMGILHREAELQQIVQLIGSDALPDSERLILETARMIREAFLQQDSFHKVDSYCPVNNQYKLLACIKEFHDKFNQALVAGATFNQVSDIGSRKELSKAKYMEDIDGYLRKLTETLARECTLWGENE